MGSLQEALLQGVDDAVEQKFLEILRRKVTGAVRRYVDAVRAVEEAYGPEGCEAMRRYQRRKLVERNAERGAVAADNSLRAFCSALEEGCRGSHEWQKLEDTERRQAYRFTRCMWAEIYRALDASDIGVWICEGDGPAASAFNPEIRFERTKTLMEGDDYCDHVFFVEDGLE